MTDFPGCFPILFRVPNQPTGLADDIRRIDVAGLCREYDQLGRMAPSRRDRNKCYFVGQHDGCLQNPGKLSEEHLAIALWRIEERWPGSSDGTLRLLDYQFPLKAASKDLGLGEVDLLGATDGGRLAVIELKVRRRSQHDDTPLLALMEGLRYTAVVHANNRVIAAEAKARFDIDVHDQPPILQILAPEDWWRGWRDMKPSTRRAAGQWEPMFIRLAGRLEARLGIAIECVSLRGIKLADVTWDAHGPFLRQTPPMHLLCLDSA